MLTKKEINSLKSVIRKKSGHRKCIGELRKRYIVKREICTFDYCNKTAEIIKRRGSKLKNGKIRYINHNKCPQCKSESRDLLDIDHIVEIGKLPYLSVGVVDWSSWIDLVFCDINNLQGLCKQCHKLKTAKFNVLESLL